MGFLHRLIVTEPTVCGGERVSRGRKIPYFQLAFFESVELSTQNLGWFIGYFWGEEILQLMIDWWFGLVVWIPGIPLRKGLLLRGYP